MLKRDESTHRVKMYKKGRTWVFAGVLTAALAFAAPEGVQADTTGETPSPAKAETTTTTNAHQDQEVTLTTPDVDGHPTTTETESVTDIENESGITNDSVTAGDFETEAEAEATTTPEKPVTAVTTEDPQTVEPITADTILETAVPISETAKPKTHKQTGATTELKAVKLVKAEVAKPATVKLAHQQRATAISEWMPNTTLQQAVLKNLKSQNPGQSWSSVDDITQDDMALLKSLSIQSGAGTYIDGKTEFSLVGLEYATNLTSLSMGGNLDAAPGAYYGDIADVTPLAGLTKLEKLDLQHNRITDVTPLANLTNLKELLLAFNRIRDFSPLKGINYTKFHAGSQMVILDPVKVSATDLSAHLKIQFITIDGDLIQLEQVPVRIADPVFYYNGAFTYRFYFTGGVGVSDGQGGLNYTELQPQIPGITEYPNVTVDPQENNYFLTGRADGSDSYGSYLFVVAQGYDIAEDAAPVVVQHHDEQGNAIAKDVTLPTGMVGEDYTTAPLDIPGYKLKTTPENATGQYGSEAITVTYVYEKDGGGTVTPPVVTPAADVTMTIYYQLADGTNIAASQRISGKPGTAYSTSALDVTGYTLVTTPGNASGAFGDTDGTITYVYEKTETGGDGDLITDGNDGDEGDLVTDDADDGQKPSVSVTTAQGDGGAGATASGQPVQLANGTTAATPQKSAAAATTLPQTNDQATSAWWGVALLAATTIGGWLGVRRKSE
ncbi:MucBP domain-containing protein [Levilactobacillus wangkuiensis]|uniref:MucBP domain-containing protein n=1 Tax=Levilactobacillus wangkuiensis TaxID=2799566 RepID=UPI001943EB9C|nr:MucBP domain-containing protein [Levilactobacillus wangkuiensis]